MRRIIFFGTSHFAQPVLRALIDNSFNVVGVVTVPDKPKGRKNELSSSPIAQTANELGLPLFQPGTLRSEEFLNQFRELNADICIVAAYGKLIPNEYLEKPKFGFLNIHPSLLPKYRGPTPVQTAILDREEGTGVSIILLDSEMDHGPILIQEPEIIQKDDTFIDLNTRLWEKGSSLLVKILPQWLNGSTQTQPQDHTKATFTKKFIWEDGRIDWSKPGEEINAQIKALNPEPGTWTTVDGKILKILKVGLKETPSISPGLIDEEKAAVLVGTGSGAIELLEIQLEGGKAMTAREFVRGRKGLSGKRLE